MFAFALKPGIDNYTVFDLSERLRDRGWLVPAYSFPRTAKISTRSASWCATGSRVTSPTCSWPT